MKNFKDQYDRYIAGTASAEETRYVEYVLAHLGEAKRAEKKTIAPDTATVENIRRKHQKQHGVFALCGTVIALVATMGSVLGVIFG